MRSFGYEILRRAGLKHTYITIDPTGKVLVKAHPNLSTDQIEKLVRQKSGWIEKKLRLLEERSVAPEGRLFYLGERYTPRQLQARYGSPLENPAQIDRFYRERARALILPLVEAWSGRMGLVPSFVGFRKNRSRWGSCSATHRLSFNTNLAKTPHPFIEYVVVHELAHIRHPNHSRHFWELVAHHLPDYTRRRTLGENPHYLL